MTHRDREPTPHPQDEQHAHTVGGKGSGNAEFTAYHARMYPVVQRVVGKYLRRWPGEVDTVANRVMEKLWQGWPLPSVSNAYAVRAARNACFDHLKSLQGLYAAYVSIDEDGATEPPAPSSQRPIEFTSVQGCAQRDEARLIAAFLGGLGYDRDVIQFEQALAEIVGQKLRELLTHVDERTGEDTEFREAVIATFVAAMEHDGEEPATQKELAKLLGRSSPMVARYIKILLAGLGIVVRDKRGPDKDPDPKDPTPLPGGGAPLAGAKPAKGNGGPGKKRPGKGTASALAPLDLACDLLDDWIAGDIVVFEEILAAEVARKVVDDIWFAMLDGIPSATAGEELPVTETSHHGAFVTNGPEAERERVSTGREIFDVDDLELLIQWLKECSIDESPERPLEPLSHVDAGELVPEELQVCMEADVTDIPSLYSEGQRLIRNFTLMHLWNASRCDETSEVYGNCGCCGCVPDELWNPPTCTAAPAVDAGSVLYCIDLHADCRDVALWDQTVDVNPYAALREELDAACIFTWSDLGPEDDASVHPEESPDAADECPVLDASITGESEFSEASGWLPNGERTNLMAEEIVMPSHLYPGVYVQEPSGVHPIKGVGTSTAVFVGAAARGRPFHPTYVTSWTEFERSFGPQNLSADMPLAVHHFFRNGGTRTYVVRLVDLAASAGEASFPTIGGDAVVIEAAGAGVWSSSMRVEIHLRSASHDLWGAALYDIVVLDTIEGQDFEIERIPRVGIQADAERFYATIVNLDSHYIRVALPEGRSAFLQNDFELEYTPENGRGVWKRSMRLAGGDDGDPNHLFEAAVIARGLAALDVLDDIHILVIPGGYTREVVDAGLRYVARRPGILYLFDSCGLFRKDNPGEQEMDDSCECRYVLDLMATTPASARMVFDKGRRAMPSDLPRELYWPHSGADPDECPVGGVSLAGGSRLLHGAERDDRAMAAALYECYRAAVTRYFRRNVRSEDDVGDLVQQTFLAIIRTRREPDDIRGVRSDVFGVALYQKIAIRAIPQGAPPLDDAVKAALYDWIDQCTVASVSDPLDPPASVGTNAFISTFFRREEWVEEDPIDVAPFYHALGGPLSLSEEHRLLMRAIRRREIDAPDKTVGAYPGAFLVVLREDSRHSCREFWYEAWWGMSSELSLEIQWNCHAGAVQSWLEECRLAALWPWPGPWRRAVMSHERIPVIEEPWPGHGGARSIDRLLSPATMRASSTWLEPCFGESARITVWDAYPWIGARVVHPEHPPANVSNRADRLIEPSEPPSVSWGSRPPEQWEDRRRSWPLPQRGGSRRARKRPLRWSWVCADSSTRRRPRCAWRGDIHEHSSTWVRTRDAARRGAPSETVDWETVR